MKEMHARSMMPDILLRIHTTIDGCQDRAWQLLRCTTLAESEKGHQTKAPRQAIAMYHV